jgi:hypothetical protein
VIGGPKGAAAKLGLKRTTLIHKMEKLGITRSGHQGSPNTTKQDRKNRTRCRECSSTDQRQTRNRRTLHARVFPQKGSDRIQDGFMALECQPLGTEDPPQRNIRTNNDGR